MPLARRWAQLIVGLFGWAVAIALMIRSGIGLGPWDAFHLGLHELTGISVGMASVLTGLVIVAGSLFIGVRPGAGTLANMVLIGVFVDLLLPHVPPAAGWMMGLAYFIPALAVIGLATGFYIAPGLGSGPRDGLMLALSARTGWPVRRVRTLIELSALGAGWLMGGTIGLGTLIYALLSGPSVQWGLRVCGVLPSASPRVALPLPEPAPPPPARRDAA